MKRKKISGHKRRIAQILSLFLINGNFKTFLTGGLYEGKLKNICIPVLNCHSCPFALTACPVGMLQQFLALGLRQGFTGFLYILGLIGLPAMFLGRFFCGWLCPFGFFQELIFVRKFKLSFPPWLKYLKYLFLFGFVLVFPMIFTNKFGIGAPAFCKYICPAGTAEAGFWGLWAGFGGFGFVLAGKMAILAAVIFFSVRIWRFFCRVCPLGLILGFFNKISLLQLRLNDRCDNCGVCERICPMNIAVPVELISKDCIRCGKCVDACPQKALSLSFKKKANG
ncbi:MAG: 4Fe-4S binding protein [Candidatus Omnitrophota bacterium]|nr:4Fe-4S binding protein [Candidatus Omnitrophota bacterium]MBU3929199.1 4Fe-4S binding protein [bacterium]MBU4123743.1 4Fe-4S binding protein [bacterium]